jgi:hypothetical protein
MDLSSEKKPTTVSFGVNSKTSKSKADESQILNEVQNLFADISKYIFKYFIEKDERENFVKGIVKW